MAGYDKRLLCWSPNKRLRGECQYCLKAFMVGVSEVGMVCVRESACDGCIKGWRASALQKLERSRQKFWVERICMQCFEPIKEVIPIDGNARSACARGRFSSSRNSLITDLTVAVRQVCTMRHLGFCWALIASGPSCAVCHAADYHQAPHHHP